MKKVSCVIMDWAGTAVDFGCFAPLNAFLRVFQEQGVTITYRQAREPLLPSAPVHGRSGEQGEDAAALREHDRRLLPALRGHGRLQRRVLHHL